ncbi:uncharacterized protein P884DRAFT_263980 [Thermothelomyces heterothallicus CBS 202.75]|uniref:uncharacterized protein n=1 Tax=Thermothelomyces heterothallicus CBS 202.75 TaxID=1149848 RepID=UPI0037435F78
MHPPIAYRSLSRFFLVAKTAFTRCMAAIEVFRFQWADAKIRLAWIKSSTELHSTISRAVEQSSQQVHRGQWKSMAGYNGSEVPSSWQ